MGGNHANKQHPAISWAKGIISACSQMQKKSDLESSDRSHLLGLMAHPNTAALAKALSREYSRSESLLSNESLSHIKSTREPILHYTDKVRDVWRENAILFKLPGSLMQMHQQASRSGADPQHMGLLIMQAIAYGAMHVLLLEQFSRLELQISTQELKQLEAKEHLSKERHEFEYAQQYANPAFLAQQEAKMREYLSLIKAMIEGRSLQVEAWNAERIRLNQLASQISQLHERIAGHFNQIHQHHEVMQALVAEYLTAAALMHQCPDELRNLIQILSDRSRMSYEDGFELVTRVLGKEVNDHLVNAHGNLEANAHFDTARNHAVANMWVVLEELVQETPQQGRAMTPEQLREVITQRVSARDFDGNSPEALSRSAEVVPGAFEQMKPAVCDELVGVKEESNQLTESIDEARELFNVNDAQLEQLLTEQGFTEVLNDETEVLDNQTEVLNSESERTVEGKLGDGEVELLFSGQIDISDKNSDEEAGDTLDILDNLSDEEGDEKDNNMYFSH